MMDRRKFWGIAPLITLAALTVNAGTSKLAAQQAAFTVCPSPDSWVMSVWLGPNGTPTEEAARTCTEVRIDAVWSIDPATQQWHGLSLEPEVPDAARGSLRTIDNLQTVFLRGGPTAAPVSPSLRYSIQRISDYVDTAGVFHVVGEVKNNTTDNVQLVKVTADFFDAQEAVIARVFTYTCLDIIPPGGESPFDLMAENPSPSIARYTLQVDALATPERPASALEVSKVTASLSSIGAFHVTGLVTNRSDTTYQFVQVCGALYDGGGLVMRAGFTFTNPDTLVPGQSGSFDFFKFVYSAPVADYRLWVQGKRQ